MPRIVEECPYNGFETRVKRLGIESLIDEIRAIVTGFELRVNEEQDTNGGAAVRKLLGGAFTAAGGWEKKQSGGVDWTKCRAVNGTRVCVGIEVQVSARSDLLVMDIIHLRKAITDGAIDAGIIIVPSDRLSNFLTDRAPAMADAKRHVKEAKADDLPLLLVALEHDGSGPALAKQAKKTKP